MQTTDIVPAKRSAVTVRRRNRPGWRDDLGRRPLELGLPEYPSLASMRKRARLPNVPRLRGGFAPGAAGAVHDGRVVGEARESRWLQACAPPRISSTPLATRCHSRVSAANRFLPFE